MLPGFWKQNSCIISGNFLNKVQDAALLANVFKAVGESLLFRPSGEPHGIDWRVDSGAPVVGRGA